MKKVIMSLRILTIIFIILIVMASLASGQNKEKKEKRIQWEYLVIGNMETQFGSPLLDSNKTVDLYKQAIDRIVGSKMELESTTTELLLDNQGAEGWELVFVIGTLGGKQEFIFKRVKNN